MERVVRTLFPTSRVERNNKVLGLVSEIGNALEIDCYLPDLKLGFEYQVGRRAREKRKQCVFLLLYHLSPPPLSPSFKSPSF
jgi:hypothetical protein